MFFRKLKEGVGTISQEIAKMEEKMQTPKSNMAENSALLKILEVKESIGSFKEEVNKTSEEMEKYNIHSIQYCNDIEELVTEMEDKISNIESYLESYGYKPYEVPKTEKNDIQPMNSDCSTPVKHEDSNYDGNNLNKKLELILAKTPSLMDYGLLSKNRKYCPSTTKQKQGELVQSHRKPLSARCLLNAPSQMSNAEASFGSQIDKLDNSANANQMKLLSLSAEWEKNCSSTNGGTSDESLLLSVTSEADRTPEEPLLFSVEKNRTGGTPDEPLLLSATKHIGGTPENPLLLSMTKRKATENQFMTPKTPELTLTYRNYRMKERCDGPK